MVIALRQSKLLLLLNENIDHYLSAKTLASSLKVSTRTIINDINFLNFEGKHSGFLIKSKRMKGYYLEIVDKNLFEAYVKNVENDLDYSDVQNRISDIVVILLLHNHYLTQNQLAQLFSVSKSTMQNDLSNVKKICEKKGLIVDSRPYYGTKLVIKSFYRYVLLTEYFYNNNHMIQSMVNKMEHDTEPIILKLTQLLNKYDVHISNTNIEKSNTFLKIQILTHHLNQTENINKIAYDSKDFFDDIVKELSVEIRDKMDVCFSEEEIKDLGQYLRINFKRIEKNKLVQLNEIKDFIDDSLSVLSKDFGLKLDDSAFKENLILHMQLLLDRLHQNITFENPLRDQISTCYPTAYDMAIKFSIMVHDQYHVNIHQDEVSFIATHFAVAMEKNTLEQKKLYRRIAVICSSGGGSAYLIQLKLKSIFSESTIHTFSRMNIDEVILFKPDVIFSTLDLIPDINIPVIHIKELADDIEINRIWNSFENTYYNQKISSYIQESTFKILENKKTYEEIIKEMSIEVVKNNWATKDYVKYVLEREKAISTIYSNGVAIPHPMTMCGIKNTISVCVVKDRMLSSEKDIKLIFLINLRKDSYKLHKTITAYLVELMENKKAVEELSKVNSFDEFMRIIYEWKGDVLCP